MLKKKKGKKRIIVNINVRLLYSENNIWSQRYRLWERYEVHKPRLPNDLYRNTRLIENPDNIPKSFSLFVGKHNSGIFTALTEVLDKFEKIKLLPDVLTIHGPSGSGKSAIAQVLMHELIELMKFKPGQSEKWCLFMDAKKYKKDLATFWSRVSSFAEPPLEKFVTAKYRLLVVDNFDSIPPSSQQILKRIMEAYSGTLKYIFVCPDPKACMINFVLTKSTNFRTRSINERDALQVVLSICNQHRIGFEREGIKAVFSLHPNRSLSNMLNLIDEVFLQRYYVSRENVLRIAVGKSSDVSDLPVIAQHRAVEPFERCKACTLKPPCQHITLEDLVKQGIARRKELPRYKAGSMSCPEFVRYGYCTMFNRTGHCSLDHPKNLHTVKKFAVRCPQCSIVWPCNHCDFTKYRRTMQELIGELHARIGRIRAINVPEPPVSLTRHLEHIPAWREQLRHIGRKYMTPEYAALITQATEWLETSYCTRKDEYRKREKTLREAFGEMYTTRILEDAAVAQGRATATPAGNQKPGQLQLKPGTAGGSVIGSVSGGGSLMSGSAGGSRRAVSPAHSLASAHTSLAGSQSPPSRSSSPSTSPQAFSRKFMSL